MAPRRVSVNRPEFRKHPLGGSHLASIAQTPCEALGLAGSGRIDIPPSYCHPDLVPGSTVPHAQDWNLKLRPRHPVDPGTRPG